MANDATTTTPLPPSRLSFRDKLQARLATTKTATACLCVGLDPHAATTADAAFTLCKTIVDATSHVAVCYKPNAAFFECHGSAGVEALTRLCRDVIPPDIPILLDVKRGDIGSTARAYAKACYDVIGADAVTLSPLMGWDSIEPFVTGDYADRGAFLLCKTSNPGSNELLTLPAGSAGTALYEHIARLVATTYQSNCTAFLGLVVGATDPVALQAVRKVAPDTWILAPGVGAQGATVADTVQATQGGHNLMVPVSRGISQAADPGAAAEALCAELAAATAGGNDAAAAADTTDSAVLPQHQRDFLAFSLEQGVLKFGSFVLKSGRTSPYFFNAGLFSTGKALYRLGKAYAATIMQCPELVSPTTGAQFDVIFGPAYKGISLGAVVSSVLYSDFGVDVGFGYNRKEAKDHGEGGTLVGSALPQQRVVILDDVITAGTAVREVVELLHKVQAKPVGVVIALDRDEIRATEDRISAVQSVARDLGISVLSIVGLKELQMFLEQSSQYDATTLASVIQYRKEYGAS